MTAGDNRPANGPTVPDAVRPGRRRAAAVALTAYTILAVALFSSAWVHPRTLSVGMFADSQLMMWFLGWPPFAVTHGQNPVFTNYLDYPGGVNLMWNASLLLPALVLGPLTQLAGFVLSYNVMMTLAVGLSAWTAFVLIRRFVSSPLAAGAGGLVYGFSPFMTAQSLAHPYMSIALMPPLILLLLDDIVRVQRRRPLVSGVLLGLVGAAQLFIGEEVLAIAAVVSLLLLCLAAGLWKDQIVARWRHAAVGIGTGAVVFALIAAIPIGFQFLGPQHLLGTVQPANEYVSDTLSFLVPSKNFLLAPSFATYVARRFQGGAVEANSYVGVLLAALLVYIVARHWTRLEVRFVALGAAVIAILSLGITLHFAGRALPIPVVVVGLVFLVFRRHLPALLMIGLTTGGWLALTYAPVARNILPTRLMLFFYLLVGLLIAVWLDDLRQRERREERLGWLALAASLALWVPAMPYPTTLETVPAFFAGGAVASIPDGSVALVIPFASRGETRAMIWQERAGLRFRMPEGYAFIPDAPPRGARVSPPLSTTQMATIVIAVGRGQPPTDQVRRQILGELKSWNVQTVIVGPMNNQQEEIDLFTSVLGRGPQLVDGVYVWWNVSAAP